VFSFAVCCGTTYVSLFCVLKWVVFPYAFFCVFLFLRLVSKSNSMVW
jgi:hypothetical protein